MSMDRDALHEQNRTLAAQVAVLTADLDRALDDLRTFSGRLDDANDELEATAALAAEKAAAVREALGRAAQVADAWRDRFAESAARLDPGIGRALHEATSQTAQGIGCDIRALIEPWTRHPIRDEPLWVWRAPDGQPGPRWIAKFGGGRAFPIYFKGETEAAVREKAEAFRADVIARNEATYAARVDAMAKACSNTTGSPTDETGA